MRFTLPFFSGVNDFDDVVFEHRNKAYGAYELRTHYNERLQKAFLILLSMVALLLISFHFLQKENVVMLPTDRGGVSPVPPPIIEIIPKKTQPQFSQPPTSTEKRPFALVNDSANLSTQKVDTANSISSTGSPNSSSGNSGDVSSLAADTAVSSQGTAAVVAKDPDKVITFAEVMPSFPGGPKALARYLGNKFTCNDGNQNGFSREGKIILKFAVMRDGSIRDISVLQETVSIDCVEQAKQILLHGPKWIPGRQNDEAVNVMVVQPITFTVQ